MLYLRFCRWQPRRYAGDERYFAECPALKEVGRMWKSNAHKNMTGHNELTGVKFFHGALLLYNLLSLKFWRAISFLVNQIVECIRKAPCTVWEISFVQYFPSFLRIFPSTTFSTDSSIIQVDLLTCILPHPLFKYSRNPLFSTVLCFTLGHVSHISRGTIHAKH